MKETTPQEWSLDDFLATVGEELSRLGVADEAPDRRTVRYYASIGVLDKPRAEGREVRYSTRHLAQVLAIKRLQAEGVRLAAIAERLAGLSTADLQTFAEDPGDRPWTRDPGTVAHLPTRTPFWERRPAPLGAAPTGTTGVTAQTRIRLTDGVHLVIDADLSRTEGLSLVQAAAPLLARLTELGVRHDTDH